jgi:hypothetical protein
VDYLSRLILYEQGGIRRIIAALSQLSHYTIPMFPCGLMARKMRAVGIVMCAVRFVDHKVVTSHRLPPAWELATSRSKEPPPLAWLPGAGGLPSYPDGPAAGLARGLARASSTSLSKEPPPWLGMPGWRGTYQLPGWARCLAVLIRGMRSRWPRHRYQKNPRLGLACRGTYNHCWRVHDRQSVSRLIKALKLGEGGNRSGS